MLSVFVLYIYVGFFLRIFQFFPDVWAFLNCNIIYAHEIEISYKTHIMSLTLGLIKGQLISKIAIKG